MAIATPKPATAPQPAKPSSPSSPSLSAVPSPSSPSLSSAAPRIASLDPKYFAPDFDVVSELATNKGQYKGDETITMYNVPSSITLNIDRIRGLASRLSDNGKPGTHPTYACCLAYGVSILGSNPHIRSLIKYRERLDSVQSSTAALEVEELRWWFESFIVSATNFSGSRERPVNIKVSEDVKRAIGALATELGASISAMCILCTVITLADQNCTLDQHQAQFSDSISVFYKRAEIRAGMAELLIDRLEKAQGEG